MVAILTTHHSPDPCSHIEGEECVGERRGGLKNPPSTFTKYQREVLIYAVNELLNNINRPAQTDGGLEKMVAELKVLYQVLQAERTIDELFQDNDPHEVCMNVISSSRKMIKETHQKAGHPVDVEIRLAYQNGSGR